MAELEQYHKRYFDTRPGEVALTCCALCGAVVWNPALHERTYHSDNQGSNQGTDQGNEVVTATSEAGDPVESQSVGSEVSDGEQGSNGTSSSGRDSATDRPVSSPPTRGAGRTTAAGTGKQSRR